MDSFKVVIPARYGSERLPGKPLWLMAGKPMIQHVWQRACESGADEVVVATDDQRIAEAVEGFGAQVEITAPELPSGTDRVAVVAARRGWAEQLRVVNLQGDEPLMEPELIGQVAANLNTFAQADIATVCGPLAAADYANPNAVKVVRDEQGYALYFSRAPLPWQRGGSADQPSTELVALCRRHIGLYAYRVSALQRYPQLSATALEQFEALEQLRAMGHGLRIHCADAVCLPGPGVDTEQDAIKVTAIIQQHQANSSR